jgi:hypothetical protein
MPIFEKLLLKI